MPSPNASIVDFFATMISTSIIDILLVDKFFNVSCTRPALLCGMDADVNADCMDAGAQARGIDAVYRQRRRAAAFCACLALICAAIVIQPRPQKACWLDLSTCDHLRGCTDAAAHAAHGGARAGTCILYTCMCTACVTPWRSAHAWSKCHCWTCIVMSRMRLS